MSRSASPTPWQAAETSSTGPQRTLAGLLYVDGEVPASALQTRLADIAVEVGTEAHPGMLRLITPDLAHRPIPDLATTAGQEAVNAVLDATELIVLDNLSCLARSGGREN